MFFSVGRKTPFLMVGIEMQAPASLGTTVVLSFAKYGEDTKLDLKNSSWQQRIFGSDFSRRASISGNSTMSDGDNASVPIVPTARKLCYEPSYEYVQFLDIGGELAELDPLKRAVTIKAAVKNLKARTISELSDLIDSTGKVDPAKCDKIDDMPIGNDQVVAARTLLSECLLPANDMIIYLLTRPPFELRCFALDLGCDKDTVYTALAQIEKSFELAKLIYKSDKYDQFASPIGEKTNGKLPADQSKDPPERPAKRPLIEGLGDSTELFADDGNDTYRVAPLCGIPGIVRIDAGYADRENNTYSPLKSPM